jgi:hypothetical protein
MAENIDYSKYGASDNSVDYSKYGDQSIQPDSVSNPQDAKPDITDEQKEQLKNKMGVNRTPLSGLQDIAVGAMRGGQNLASALGQVGQYIANKVTGGYAPQVDIREQMGLGKNNPVDFQNVIGSRSPNALVQAAAQYAPAMMTGRGVPLGEFGNAVNKIPYIGNIVRNVLSAGTKPAAYMATQNENPFVGAAEGYGGQAAAELLPYAIPTGKAAYQGAKSIINAFRPGAESENFIQSLGGGTSEQNAERVANTINTSAQNQLQKALEPKNKVMSAIGRKQVTDVPMEELPEGNVDKVIGAFGKKINEVAPNDIADLNTAIKAYRKHGDFDQFLEDGQHALGVDKLSSKQEDKLESMLDIPTKKDISYYPNDKTVKSYGNEIKQLNDKYINNRSFQNAHLLESKMNMEIRNLQKFAKQGVNIDRGKLDSLISDRSDILSEMNDTLKDQPEEVQNLWKEFKNKYRQDYSPYERTKQLAQISKGETKGARPETLRKIFSYPKEYVQKILKDLPTEGKNYILYNELHDVKPNDAEEILSRLEKLKQSKGYSHLMSPEIEAQKNLIAKKMRNKNSLINIGSLGTVPLSKNIGSKLINALVKR